MQVHPNSAPMRHLTSAPQCTSLVYFPHAPHKWTARTLTVQWLLELLNIQLLLPVSFCLLSSTTYRTLQLVESFSFSFFNSKSHRVQSTSASSWHATLVPKAQAPASRAGAQPQCLQSKAPMFSVGAQPKEQSTSAQHGPVASAPKV
ncbi:hypothetical protein FNV43_RR06056 [Rhamnella rubrinervis]|uniref:Uncharacterized protein n=1 Tax=Rhamnella rubrinervis TaxID=2594499 RepID=A0A8K0ML48_9ROSA|nr:hypothetical protein FNV43_RR06056 [Rhamnella rubrinervis]